MIEIIDRRRTRKMNTKGSSGFTKQALLAIASTERTATIVFVSDAAIKKLNRQFRGKNYATDVLSFPSRAEAFEKEDQLHLGDVVISIDRAAAQAKENGLTFENE